VLKLETCSGSPYTSNQFQSWEGGLAPALWGPDLIGDSGGKPTFLTLKLFLFAVSPVRPNHQPLVGTDADSGDWLCGQG